MSTASDEKRTAWEAAGRADLYRTTLCCATRARLLLGWHKALPRLQAADRVREPLYGVRRLQSRSALSGGSVPPTPQPGGFEGLVQSVELLNPRDLAVPQLAECRQFQLGPNPTLPANAPLTAWNEDAIAGLDVIEVLDVILAEELQPRPQVLDQAVQAVVAVADVQSERVSSVLSSISGE